MIGVDYFLYDNRTSAQWGRDWGIKAATGVLANRADLKSDFSRYCGTMPSEHGRLSGFGEAIGGMRSRMAKGYLLCVTLESSDLSGRPSWAVFGLWCPDLVTLEDVLTGDIVASARSILGAETPPAVIHIKPATTAIRASHRRKSPGTLFLRFQRGTTSREVIAVLLGATLAKTTLPNILGITATSRLPALAEGFDRVYSHPMDDRTERVLAHNLSRPDSEVEEPWPATVQATTALATSPRTMYRKPASSDSFFWPLLVIAVAIAVAFYLSIDDSQRDFIFAGATTESSASVTRAAPGTDTAPAATRSPEDVLQEIGKRLEEVKKLDPQALRDSSGYFAAHNVPVIDPGHSERVRAAYSSLIETRERMVKRVAYFFDEEGRNADSVTRLEKITAILEERPLGDGCAVLQNAFAFEFEDEESVVSHWCDSLSKLENAAGLPPRR
jgi:hypothetical protein